MKGIDPSLAYMGVVAVAIAGLGFAIHSMRDILAQLHAAQRAADRAATEHQLAQADLTYDQRLTRYEDALARYEASRASAPVRKKKAPSPPVRPVKAVAPTIRWNPDLKDAADG